MPSYAIQANIASMHICLICTGTHKDVVYVIEQRDADQRPYKDPTKTYVCYVQAACLHASHTPTASPWRLYNYITATILTDVNVPILKLIIGCDLFWPLSTDTILYI